MTMKAVFFYPEVCSEYRFPDWLEIGTAAAMLRARGWKVESAYLKSPRQTQDILRRAAAAEPNLLVAMIALDQEGFALDFLQQFRALRPQALVAGCGTWASFHAEKAVVSRVLDAAIAAEWEPALDEFAAALAGGGSYTNLAGMILRNPTSGATVVPPRPPFPAEQLPAPARDLFPYRDVLSLNGGEMPIGASRGCPFRCAFCHEPLYAMMQTSGPGGQGGGGGQGGAGGAAPAAHRARNPQAVVEEGAQLAGAFDPERFVFVDSMFPWEESWLRDFSAGWADEVRRPFTVTTALELAKPAVLDLLHEAGCDRVVLGIEVGDDHFRRTIANRNLGNSALLQFRQLLDERGIEMITTNLLGLPHETPALLDATVELNHSLDPIEIRTRILVPVPGSPVGETIAREKIEMNERTPQVVDPDVSVLRLPSLSQQDISRAYDRLALLDGVLKAHRRHASPPVYADLIERFAEGKLRSPWRRAVRIATWRRNRIPREALALRAPSEIVFDLDARPNSAFAFGITAEPTLRGLRCAYPIQFSLKLTQGSRTIRLFRKHLLPAFDPDARRWHDYLFPLRDISPGPFRLVLQVQMDNHDLENLGAGEEIWGGWSNPCLIETPPSSEATPKPISLLEAVADGGTPIMPGALAPSQPLPTKGAAARQNLRDAGQEIARLQEELGQASRQREAYRFRIEDLTARLAQLQVVLEKTEMALEDAELRAAKAEERLARPKRRPRPPIDTQFPSLLGDNE